MEIFFYIILLILIGAFFAFLSGIISALSFDSLTDTQSGKSAKIIKQLKLNYEESQNAFYILEVMFYLFSAVLAGFAMQSTNMLSVIVCACAIICDVFFRTFLYSLGVRYANQAGGKFLIVLYAASIITYPFNRILLKINEKITGDDSDDSMDELNAIVETAREDGTLEIGEYKILKNIMHFSDVLASDVMTPRTVVFSCLADTRVEDALKINELKMYSRIPLREGPSLDDGVIGYVMSKDIYSAALSGKTDAKIQDFKREIHYIPENAELDDVLDQFLKKRQHLFLVVDEYGGIDGLITMEDVLETILGAEIVDEADKFVDLRALAKQKRDKRIAVANN